MTTVRIAHAEPRPGKLPNGGFSTRGFLVVLADDAGHRAVPIWMQAEPGDGDLSQLLELAARSAGEIVTTDAPQELTARLLGAAGASVTGVDIDLTVADTDELTPQVSVTRIGLDSPRGTRHVTAGLGLGLAMAAAAGAPVRLADAVLDRVARPVSGDDLLTSFLDHVPPAGQLVTVPGQRPCYEPRNLSFADGLDRWDLDLGPRREADRDYSADTYSVTTDPYSATTASYSATVDGPSAILSSAVPRPVGTAALIQAIYADDYRGATVVFSGRIRTEPGTEQAGLRLEILRHPWRGGREREDHDVIVKGGHDLTSHEITALIPEDADMIRFGLTLTGTGRITLRNPDLRRTKPSTTKPGTKEPAETAPDAGA
jgi:hypothetical protein